MPRDSALRTLLRAIGVCLHTVKLHVCMLWLTMIMQRPAIARRTIAIELLRQLDRMEAEGRRSPSTPPRRRSDAAHGNVHFTPVSLDTRRHQHNSLATRVQFPLHRQDPLAEAATSRISTSSDGTGPEKLVSQVSAHTMFRLTRVDLSESYSFRGVWTETWPRDPRNLERLRAQAEANARAEPAPAASPGIHDDALEPVGTSHSGDSQASAIADEAGKEGRPPPRDSPVESDCAPLLTDYDSTSSDATLPEDSRSSTPLSGKSVPSLDEDTVAGARESESGSPDRTLVPSTEELSTKFDESYRPQYRRGQSIDSEASITKTSPKLLRARSRTNGGLLEFRANATRPTDSKRARIHQRNVSLGLPVRPALSQPAVQATQAPPTAANALALFPNADDVSTAARTDRVLEYKHRHIFVGTASLHSFLEALETSLDCTSRPAVMKAFTALASHEQLLARQASSSTADWNLVTRTTPDISTFDYITLARVQLGSVSLQHFVDLIPFRADGTVRTAVVVEAFKNASHVDAQAGLNSRSKARAFRRAVMECADQQE